MKPPLVGEYGFPLTGFVCWSARVKFGGGERGGLVVESLTPEREVEVR